MSIVEITIHSKIVVVNKEVKRNICCFSKKYIKFSITMTLKTERSTKYPACKGGQKSVLHKNTQKRKASDRNFESIGQTPFS